MKNVLREKTWISLEWHKKGPRFSMRIEEGHGIYIEMYLLTKLAKKMLVSVYLYWRIGYMKLHFWELTRYRRSSQKIGVIVIAISQQGFMV